MPKAIDVPTTSVSLSAESGTRKLGRKRAGNAKRRKMPDSKPAGGRGKSHSKARSGVPSARCRRPADLLSTGTVMHRPLFLDDDLTGAASECGLTPLASVDAEGCARKLNDEVFHALSMGLAQRLRPPRDAALKELCTLDEKLSALLQGLGLGDPNAMRDVLPLTARALIQPGLIDPPVIPWWRELDQRLGPDLPDAIKDAHDLALLTGCDQEAAAQKATNRTHAEVGLRLLAPSLDVLRRVIRQAIGSVREDEKAREGRKRDVAADKLLRALACAHVAMFGFVPKLRDGEGARDTPSIRWINLLLQTAAARADAALGENSREAVKVRRLGSLAPATLNNRIAKAMPGNGSAVK